MIIKKKIDDSYIYIKNNLIFNDEIKNKCKDKFEEFKKLGIISDGNFEDDVWIYYDTIENRKINFIFDQVKYRDQMLKRDLMKFKEFKERIKCFFIIKTDRLVLSSLIKLKTYIKGFLIRTEYMNIEYTKNISLIKNNLILEKRFDNLIREFIEFIDIDTSKEYLNSIDMISEVLDIYNNYNNRELGRIESFFKFDEIIEDFWIYSTKEEKEEFYPIYIWWRLTNIIPLRVKEFTIIPNNCIKIINNKYFINIRRSILKSGSKENFVSHNIDLDYKLEKVEINEEIYNIIKNYLDIVKKYDFDIEFNKKNNLTINDRKFLLSKKSFLKIKNINNYSDRDDYFSTYNLYRLQRRFYKKIVHEKYNMNVINKSNTEDELINNDIEIINIMDTRHYAIINMILNDIEPFLVKELAGHNDIESSFNYYNHLNKFVKCNTYRMAKKIIYSEGGSFLKLKDIIENKDIKINRLFDKNKLFELDKLNDGICEANNNFEKCLLVNGDCYKCQWFIPTTETAKDSIVNLIKDNYESIDCEIEEIKTLLKMYRNYKNKNKFNEDYKRRIEKIRSISSLNSELLSRYVLRE